MSYFIEASMRINQLAQIYNQYKIKYNKYINNTIKES